MNSSMNLTDTQKHSIAGICGGMASTMTLYPLDLLKTRMQVTERKIHQYRGIRNAISSVLRSEGISGFYRGMTPAIIASSTSWGGYFFFYEIAKARMQSNMDQNSSLGPINHMLAGIEAGSIMVLCTNPLWLVRTRLSLQDSSHAIATTTCSNASSFSEMKRYEGLTDALRTIYREEGIKGLYRGAIPALFLTSHGSIQFAAYEYLKARSSAHFDNNQPSWVSMINGGVSKILAALVTYPYQVIKSRLQQRESSISIKTGAFEPKYLNTRDCIMKIWKQEGVMGFFRGVWVNAFKVAPSAAVTFLVYEETMKALKK